MNMNVLKMPARFADMPPKDTVHDAGKLNRRGCAVLGTVISLIGIAGVAIGVCCCVNSIPRVGSQTPFQWGKFAFGTTEFISGLMLTPIGITMTTYGSVRLDKERFF